VRDQWYGDKTYSQHAEDLMVLNIFTLMKIIKPSYIDIGANHPINISNTYLLYERGSTGINIEPNPNLIELFKTQRPNDKNLNIGISPTGGSMNFYMIDDTSGRNTLVESEAKRFIEEYPQFSIRQVITVPTRKLNDIIDEECEGVFPDFLTMDTEGLDYDILRSTDFSKSKPKVMCIEVRPEFSPCFNMLMERNGYICYCRMGINLIYVDQIFMGNLY